jgi:hypothetical protein
MFYDLFLYLYCLQRAACSCFPKSPAVPWLENQRGPDVKTLIQEVVKNNVGFIMCVRLNLFLRVVFLCSCKLLPKRYHYSTVLYAIRPF